MSDLLAQLADDQGGAPNLQQMQGAGTTQLQPDEEDEFLRWIRAHPWHSEFTKDNGAPPNLNDPDYDYRGAWKAGMEPQRYEHDAGRYHWPATTAAGQPLKSANHPTAWMQNFMDQTGRDPHDLGVQTREDAELYLQRQPSLQYMMRAY